MFIFVHNIAILPFFENHLDKVIYDAREYYPLQNSSDEAWRRTSGKFNTYLCERYLPRCKARVTVSESIKERYENWLKTPFGVLRSCPDITLPQIELSLTTEKIRIIHHGAAIPNRKLENLIDLMALLDSRFTLDLMLVDAKPGYLAKLKKRAQNAANIRFLQPVAFEDIVETISNYDAGIHLMESRGDQHELALPNKFFEFVAAGLMLITSGSREMNNLVDLHGFGKAFGDCDNLSDIANQLNEMSAEDVCEFRRNTLDEREKFTFEAEVEVLAPFLTNP